MRLVRSLAMSWLSDRLARCELRPYPVADLAPAAGLPRDVAVAQLALALGFNRRTVGRYVHLGLDERQADRWATRLGVHPLEVWPDWGERPTTPTTRRPRCHALAG